MMLSKHICIVILGAITSITAIEIYALSQGINGTLMSAVVGVLGVISGAGAKAIYNGDK